jgi:hypothetical protein
VFRIRLFTPPVFDSHGWQHAGGELVLAETRLCFLVDLDYWSPADYADQWRSGVARLAGGAESTALMTAYRGRDPRAHLMWALWRDDTHIYIQEHSVLDAELDAPFDPAMPYEHVGEHVPAAIHGLPIPEWHVPIDRVRDSMTWLRPF